MPFLPSPTLFFPSQVVINPRNAISRAQVEFPAYPIRLSFDMGYSQARAQLEGGNQFASYSSSLTRNRVVTQARTITRSLGRILILRIIYLRTDFVLWVAGSRREKAIHNLLFSCELELEGRCTRPPTCDVYIPRECFEKLSAHM